MRLALFVEGLIVSLLPGTVLIRLSNVRGGVAVRPVAARFGSVFEYGAVLVWRSPRRGENSALEAMTFIVAKALTLTMIKELQFFISIYTAVSDTVAFNLFRLKPLQNTEAHGDLYLKNPPKGQFAGFLPFWAPTRPFLANVPELASWPICVNSMPFWLRIPARGFANPGAIFASKSSESKTMKSLHRIQKLILAGTALVALATVTATAEDTKTPPKPDKLKTCPVSGDKLGEMGKPYVFTYKGHEVKLCCPDCKKDFEKDPAKYMKKIEAADKAAAKK